MDNINPKKDQKKEETEFSGWNNLDDWEKKISVEDKEAELLDLAKEISSAKSTPKCRVLSMFSYLGIVNGASGNGWTFTFCISSHIS